jgi:hypothetical protein
MSVLRFASTTIALAAVLFGGSSRGAIAGGHVSGDDGVLWCGGADDPQCMPATPEAPAPELSIDRAHCALPNAVALAGAGLFRIRESGMSGALPDGVRYRVDRPPRI